MRRALIVAAALWLAPDARAQNTSDLMPPQPQPAPGQSPYYPGMPLPPPPDSGRGGERSGISRAGDDKDKKDEKDKKAAPTGRVVYDDLPAEATGTVEGPQPSEPVGAGTDVHVVKKGDTLWDISAQYFKNAWAWPKLWSYNPSITNPHWIYPGDLVHLRPAGAVAALPGPPSEGPRPMSSAVVHRGVFLRQGAFIEPHELEQAGRIIGSKEEKLWLATLDEAYVQFPKDQPLHPGDRVSIYNPIRPLKHPMTGKYLGEIVQIYGDAEVLSVSDGHVARIKITDSMDPIERKFRVGPLKRQFKLVEPRPSAQDLAGLVVGTLNLVELVGDEMLVFVDRGKKDGIEVGNRFLVVRRGDGYQPLRNRGMPIDDRRFPRETIGELYVLDVREGVSTCFMTRVTQEVHIGDRVEAHRSY